jgi:hypothetical protein
MMLRKVLTICLMSILIVFGQSLIAHWIPVVGSLFYIPSVIFLSVLEESFGFQTLKGSESGWPVPTNLGWQFTALFWWVFWVMLITLIQVSRQYRAISK